MLEILKEDLNWFLTVGNWKQSSLQAQAALKNSFTPSAFTDHLQKIPSKHQTLCQVLA